jgi:hypothetical protein
MKCWARQLRRWITHGLTEIVNYRFGPLFQRLTMGSMNLTRLILFVTVVATMVWPDLIVASVCWLMGLGSFVLYDRLPQFVTRAAIGRKEPR